MKLLKTFAIVVALALFGCAKQPQLAEMRQLNNKEVMDLLAKKTLTYPTSYGRWATFYFDHHLSGVAKAWGKWGKEIAKVKSTVSDDGELCETYKGNNEWSSTNDPVCVRIYIDNLGVYYSKITVDSAKLERVGSVRILQLYEGNFYNIQ